MKAVRSFLFIFFLFKLVACGGSQKSVDIVLRMNTSLAPYYTKVSVRVSGEDFEPIVQTKEGIFYPGDKVSFSVSIPEGSERLVESVIYDPAGNPVYYASKTVDLQKDTTLIMDMKPSQQGVSSYEVFANGRKLTKYVDFYLLSEDLYSINASFSTSQSGSLYPYMVGSYVAYYDGKGWRLRYLQEPSGAELLIYRKYSLPVGLPLGISSMEIYGSYEGVLSIESTSLNVSSEKMLSDGTLIFTGYADGLFYSVAKNSVSFQRACQEEGGCKVLNVSFTGEKPDAYRLFADYAGIRFPIAYGELFVYKPYLTYYLQAVGTVKEPCVMQYSTFIKLQNFTGSALLEMKFKSINFEGLSPSAKLRIYSTDGNFTMGGSCESSSKGAVRVPYQGALYIEAIYPDGKKIGVYLSPEDDKVSFPQINLEVSKYELTDKYILLKFKKDNHLSWCSLGLSQKDMELTVDKIPPWRSYLKLSRLKEVFDKLPDYTLRCYSRDGTYYVEVSSQKVLY